ncbi:hypothetical protein J5N97_001615 [Dioscorea zingiberensis]|uniref:AMP-dependent synthetase/ligase domain-containing protein n=1 Tax=Dioscorea zingiberensis TaxID=325984 RepID=A0A9D5H219_9LILI|nr:hypothetical protein J5N97_001615 [Dioscorea zingiberensis]
MRVALARRRRTTRTGGDTACSSDISSISFGEVGCGDIADHALIAQQVDAVTTDQDDTVALPFLSGTTGLPKGVVLTHKSLVSSVAQQVELGEKANVDMLALFFGREGGF